MCVHMLICFCLRVYADGDSGDKQRTADTTSSDDAGLIRSVTMERATKRVIPTPLGKWLLDKTFYLNASRTKRLVLGLDLDRQLEPYAFIDNGSGLGVRLVAEDVRELFAPDWEDKVKKHLRTPSMPGCVKINHGSDFRLNIIRDCEPGMKIATHGEDGRFNYVVLAYVSLVKLYGLGPAIIVYLAHLESLKARAKLWLLETLSKLQLLAIQRGFSSIPNEKHAADIIDSHGSELCNSSKEESDGSFIYDDHFDFVVDLHYKYRDIVARMLYDVCDRREA